MVFNYEFKVRRYGTLPERNLWLVPKRTHYCVYTRYHNVILGTTTMLKHQRIVRCKRCLDILNRVGVDH